MCGSIMSDQLTWHRSCIPLYWTVRTSVWGLMVSHFQPTAGLKETGRLPPHHATGIQPLPSSSSDGTFDPKQLPLHHQYEPGQVSQDEMATDNKYDFQGLKSDTTIRLIRVLPNRVNSCIACSIEHFDEKQQGTIEYHALSYVWGDSEPKRLIYLRDQRNEWGSVLLRENLWLFLDHAWRRKMFDQLFWTDYLCLNQGSHEELSQQVPRMQAIYRNAELVVIWLNLKENQQTVLRKLMSVRDRLMLVPEHQRSRLHFYEQIKLAHRELSLSNFRNKFRAIENPYWGRVWIVQEVVVAKKVCITTRDISTNLEELYMLFNPWHRSYHTFKEPSVWALWALRKGRNMPLWRILKSFGAYQSSRRVDRVYGMLGLVECNEDGTSTTKNIQVDYDKPECHVLLDAVFESSPPLTEYSIKLFSMCSEGIRDGLSLLEGYIGNSKTTERHREFAEIARQGFEAVDIIKMVPGAPDSVVLRALNNLFSSATETDWKPTPRQNAALIGMLISDWAARPLPSGLWKHYFERDGKALPWRCAAHSSHDGGHTGLGSYEMVAEVVTKAWNCARLEMYGEPWDGASIVDACGEQSQDCNGSMMACELSHIGIRLQVEPEINGGAAGRLSLHRQKFKT